MTQLGPIGPRAVGYGPLQHHSPPSHW